MRGLKRELSESTTGDELSKPPTTPPPKTKTKIKKKTSAASASPAAKTRLPAEARRRIALAIVHQGAVSVDIEKLLKDTGLNRQQIRSQLCDNRQNVRKQLMDLAASLQ